MGPGPGLSNKEEIQHCNVHIPHLEHQEIHSRVPCHCGKALFDPNSHSPSTTRGSARVIFYQADQQPEDTESAQKDKEPDSLLLKLALRNTTPSPAPQWGPWNSPSTYSTSTSSSGTPDKTSQCWQWVAGRFLGFILRKPALGHPRRGMANGTG